jgi:glycosyltransferase involved in cell wall biosynthesis
MNDQVIDTLTSKLQEDSDPEVALLMPVHNEAAEVEKAVMEFYNEVGRKIPLEIVCCEDGSTDGTKETLKNLSTKIPMKVILGADRKGYAPAIKDGLKILSSKYVLFVDSDRQHQPSDFFRLYQLREKYDIVSGYRVKRMDAFHRRIMSLVFQCLAKNVFKLPKLRDVTAPYRLVRTDVARKIASECTFMNESFWTEFTIIGYKKGYSMIEVPATHKLRVGGTTRVYKPSKIPKIVISQFLGLVKLWFRLKNHTQP